MGTHNHNFLHFLGGLPLNRIFRAYKSYNLHVSWFWGPKGSLYTFGDCIFSRKNKVYVFILRSEMAEEVYIFLDGSYFLALAKYVAT